MTTNITVELAHEKDYAEIVDVLVTSYTEYESAFNDKERWDKYIGEIRESLHNPSIAQLWVARIEESIVGTVQLFETAQKAYAGFESPIDYPFIRLLAVHPDWRGHGVARALLDRCVESSKEFNRDYVYLYTSPSMLNAVALYRRFGFEEDPDYHIGNDEFGAICFRYPTHVQQVESV
ncbi:GNAT family N-acetyltransferase [Paenibacillus sp. DCT19]|uniref:GNAT family N-acetyltransferase n=1 Tax=Paenibacillus sp. DCT19 TaxID=2211212 RepID=UPI000FE26758|nr:GNAT family N-acetyltransferase [Paenibacillus sp. DCT19]